MITPAIEQRLSRLVALHEEGCLTTDELGIHLVHLLNMDNLSDVLHRVPPELVGVLKEGVAADAREAASEEHLHSESSAFAGPTFIARYHLVVAESLLPDEEVKRRTVLSVVCLPSFDPEWALRLVGSQHRGFNLVLTEAREQLWVSESSSTVEVTKTVLTIPPELASGISDVWRKMLRRTRHPDSERIGKDGVNYHFTFGSMSGHIWSPRAVTLPGRLVSLSHSLRSLVLAGDAQDAALLEEIQVQIAWFRGLS
jgi:hypothetical protein